MTQIIAFHLPQFHTIPENDAWWGKGFTEWTNVKKARSLFKGHRQPRIPYNGNYYDLMNPEALIWQTNLARQYDIFGFCYYHYWFNSKKLLEKPIEQILKTKEPDFPFCLAWANEPWTRTWDGRKSQILMHQTYGDEKDWQAHFDYLTPFFNDQRYIRINDKPVFVIYRTSSIPNCDQMLAFWQKAAQNSGIGGIYFIEMMNSFQNRSFSLETEAVVEFEPLYTLASGFNLMEKIKNKTRVILNKNSLSIVDYDLLWKKIILRQNTISQKTVFGGGFVDFDNSSRRTKYAMVLKGVSPEKFENYLTLQLKRSKEVYKSEFIFFNAWNEWAEGAYLEPDDENRFQYLEAVKKALENVNSR